MALFPTTPIPSSISAPAILDPMHVFETDSGYTLRRSKHSRPRRRYTVDYLGKSVTEMHQIRDFLLTSCRLGTLPFQWYHTTAVDFINIDDTLTPVLVYYTHGLITGQWIGILNAPSHLNAIWQVTRINSTTLALNGSIAGGPATTGFAFVYLPYAVARFDQDTWESPTKLIGPEQTDAFGGVGRSGVFSWTLQVEEVF